MKTLFALSVLALSGVAWSQTQRPPIAVPT